MAYNGYNGYGQQSGMGFSFGNPTVPGMGNYQPTASQLANLQTVDQAIALQGAGVNVSPEMFGQMQQGNSTGFFGKIGGLEGLGTIAQGLASLGQLYASIQQIGLAKKQHGLQKDAYEKNWTAQKNAFNEENAYKQTMRGSYGQKPQAEIDATIAKYALTDEKDS